MLRSGVFWVNFSKALLCELQLKVGDIVRVENDQLFPADMALLSSSEPLATAYIETSNLDGETNLKIRQGLECTADLIAAAAIRDFHCEIECEHPNQNVNEFTGTLHIQDLRRPLGTSVMFSKKSIIIFTYTPLRKFVIN